MSTELLYIWTCTETITKEDWEQHVKDHTEKVKEVEEKYKKKMTDKGVCVKIGLQGMLVRQLISFFSSCMLFWVLKCDVCSSQQGNQTMHKLGNNWILLWILSVTSYKLPFLVQNALLWWLGGLICQTTHALNCFFLSVIFLLLIKSAS